jgi:hypothetical protein
MAPLLGFPQYKCPNPTKKKVSTPESHGFLGIFSIFIVPFQLQPKIFEFNGLVR